MLKKQGVREKRENKMDRGGKERMGKEIRKGKEVEGGKRRKEILENGMDKEMEHEYRKNGDRRKKIIDSHKKKNGDCKLIEGRKLES